MERAANEVKIDESGDDFVVAVDGRRFEIGIQDPRRPQGRAAGIDSSGSRDIVSPMPGKVIRVLVGAGDEIRPGQGLLVVEAMKMQNEIKAPGAGKIKDGSRQRRKRGRGGRSDGRCRMSPGSQVRLRS